MVEPFRSFILHVRQQVRIDIERKGNACVAELLTDDLWGDSCSQRARRRGVAQRGHGIGVSLKVYTSSDFEQKRAALRQLEAAVLRKQQPAGQAQANLA